MSTINHETITDTIRTALGIHNDISKDKAFTCFFQTGLELMEKFDAVKTKDELFRALISAGKLAYVLALDLKIKVTVQVPPEIPLEETDWNGMARYACRRFRDNGIVFGLSTLNTLESQPEVWLEGATKFINVSVANAIRNSLELGYSYDQIEKAFMASSREIIQENKIITNRN